MCGCLHLKMWQSVTGIDPYSQRDDPCWRRAPSTAVRDKEALQILLLRVVLCPRGRSWDVAGAVPNHICQRPLTTHIHRDDNRRHDSMACFAVRGKG